MVFGKISKKFALVVGVAGTLSVVSFAYPVNPSPRVVDNGGDSLTVRTLGDEHYRYTQTLDGFLVVADSARTVLLRNSRQKIRAPVLPRQKNS